MITVRSLLVRVKPFRPDLTDEMAMTGLRDALARIATHSCILKQEDPVEVISAGAYSVDYATKSSLRTVKIDEVYGLSTYTIRTQEGLSSLSYHGTWNATTDTPTLPAAGSGNAGYYYIVSVAGTYGGTAYVIGDVILSDGTVWKKYKPNESEATGKSRDGFQCLKEINQRTRETVDPNFQSSRPYYPAYAQNNGSILFVGPPKEDLLIFVKRSIDYSTFVDLDVDTVSIIPDAERVMIAGALEFVYNLPGENQNLNMADKYRREFQRGLENLKGLEMFGSGVPMFISGGFAGTGGTR